VKRTYGTSNMRYKEFMKGREGFVSYGHP